MDIPYTILSIFEDVILEFSIFMTFASISSCRCHAYYCFSIRFRLSRNDRGTKLYAVAASSLTDEAHEFGSLVIDIGGGSTDIALVQQKVL